jgi:predicted metal-binding transcription factor (methanogenesis marker protein 9)
MKNGDIFRWSYKKDYISRHKSDLSAGTLYWCCSNICVYNDGILRDTYWSCSSEGRRWTKKKAEDVLNLLFLANSNEITKTRVPQYYNKKDIVDLRHANNGRDNVYIKNGAKKSRRIMSLLVEYKIKDLQGSIDYKTREIERLGSVKEEIETGDIGMIHI